MTRRTRPWLVLLLLLLLVTPALAAADPLVPGRPVGAGGYGGDPPLYDDERFPPYAYTFEGASQFNSIGHVPIYFWLNQILVTKAWLLKMALRLTEYALTFDFLAPFLERASRVMTGLGDLFWQGANPVVLGALSLAGLWAVLLYLRGRGRRVWAALGGTTLVLLLAAALLASGPGWSRTANDLSRELSRQVYRTVEGIAGGNLVSRSGDALWRSLVYEPWLTGEFGSVSGEQRYGQLNSESFLLKDTEARHLICGDRTRVQAYCPWWHNDFLPQRMLIAGSTFLATLAVAGTLALLSGGIILAQLALLFLLALAPLWLLAALWWPERGMELLTRLWQKALGVLVLQVLLSLTLGLLLLFSLGVVTLFAGWMLEAVVLALLALAAFRFRTAWLEPLGAVRRWRSEQASPQRRGEEPRPTRPEATPTQWIPHFASFAQPGVAIQEEVQVGGRIALSEPTPAVPQRHFFQSEMQVLREQILLQEQPAPSSDPGNSPAFRSKEERPGSNREQPAPQSMGQGLEIVRRPPPAGRVQQSDLTRIPTQRPRP